MLSTLLPKAFWMLCHKAKVNPGYLIDTMDDGILCRRTISLWNSISVCICWVGLRNSGMSQTQIGKKIYIMSFWHNMVVVDEAENFS